MRRIVSLLVATLLLLAALSVGVGAREVKHETYTFRVGSEQEKAYLVKGAALNSLGIRYADVKDEMVYRFDIRNAALIDRIELSGPLYQQLHLLVSADGKNYTEVYRWSGTVKEGGSGGLKLERRAFDLTPYLPLKELDVLYVKIADSYTSGGWGGAIHPDDDVTLDITYLATSEEELNALEMEPSAHSVPLFGCNSSFGGGFVLDRAERVAGAASLSVVLGSADVNAVARLDAAVNGDGMDTLELELYLSDPAALKLDWEGSLTIASTGENAALIWDIQTLFSMVDTPVVGWNHVFLPLHLATSQGEAFDLCAITQLALSWQGLPTSASRYTIKLDSIRLTDLQMRQREEVIASLQVLLNTLDEMETLLTGGLDETSFRTVARLTESARRTHDDLTAAQRVVAMEYDLAARVERAEQAVADYEASLADAPPPTDDEQPPAVEQTPSRSDGEEQSPTPTDEPSDPSDDEAPTDKTRGLHPMIVAVVAACVGGALATALTLAFTKKKS